MEATMRKSEALPDILTEEEIGKLLARFNIRYQTSHRNQLMIKLALNTGMRISELINLRWEDIEPSSDGRCHIKKAKGKKDRVVFIRFEILSELLDMAQRWGIRKRGNVFITLKGDPLKDSYLRKMIADKGKKAGIEKRVHFHILRHTYLTGLYKRTKDLRIVQEVAGHKYISTTQIYTHISGEDIREAMLKEHRASV